jgi:hypothetical protein
MIELELVFVVRAYRLFGRESATRHEEPPRKGLVLNTLPVSLKFWSASILNDEAPVGSEQSSTPIKST